MNIDLHVHSAFSDGLLSPEALCALALQQQVNVLALCDHDTTDGLNPMRMIAERVNRDGQRLTVIPAVELSTGTDGRTHLLGYGVQECSLDLQAAMAQLRAKRVARGQQIVEALRGQGVEIPAQLLPEAETPGMPIGRPHVARALIRMGVVNTMEQAFDRYLATRFGVKAVEFIVSGQFGVMTALDGRDIIPVPLQQVITKKQALSQEALNMARILAR